ncbi:GlxA family transcriptional regulator [Nocardia terpenica]|uniref:AraC family transcriptional regulator n=1 Tax=Nocardia terpenica TaxID=455432 RepID=A0A291RIE9_9NOCA|nr:GlxA family transcriptional regulator [Nocardia terpenica]ATL67356.1 AraC family transcriptional regulator [Nocardia terpenica]
MRKREVLAVLFDGALSLDIAGPLDTFAMANIWSPDSYRVRTATVDGRAVRTYSGLTVVPDVALADIARPHTLLVPGGQGPSTADRAPELVEWLRGHAHRAERVVSVCTGAYLLAAAGLLDGGRATTHWRWCADLAERYPAVQVDPEPIFVRDGHVATSAGVTAGIDLALALVEDDLGRETALAVARQLVVYLRRPGNQTQFSAPLAAQLAERPRLRDIQHWIAEHPGEDLSVEALARRAQMSVRHFARTFKDDIGVTPARYVNGIRLEAARRMLEDTDRGIDEIARRCGFGTTEVMRQTFLRALGTIPTEYRRRLRP